MSETVKSYQTRLAEGFFDKYINGKGIDLGVGRLDSVYGADPVHPDVEQWDKDNGDATFMETVADNTYDYVHASHLLEHIANPYLALRNWLRILKPGGFLIILVPHRDLYEKRVNLPSQWNLDHKFFILPDTEDLPHTINLTHLLESVWGPEEAKIEYVKVRDHDFDSHGFAHSSGEYSIEAVIKKL